MRIFSALLLIFTLQVFAAEREIALTIDDLPLVASKMDTPGNQQRSTERFTRLLEAIVENKVPAVGFVIAGAIGKGQWEFLEKFRAAGLELGNHTYSHYSLNSIGADKYIQNIDKADKILAPIMTAPRYFRYPYLAEGAGANKQKVLDYLSAHNYQIAPVTIDSKDYAFNEQAYKVPFRARENYILQNLKKRYLAFIWHQTEKAEKRTNPMQPAKQILLIHANLINSYLLGDIIQMYKEHGYKFISLAEALKNVAPVLQFPTQASKPSEEQAADGGW